MSASIEPLRRRIAINLLICLLRGVNANHTDKIEFVEDDLTALRNPAIFLLLFATKFAKRALPELGVKATH
jgi:hypothetical protein